MVDDERDVALAAAEEVPVAELDADPLLEVDDVTELDCAEEEAMMEDKELETADPDTNADELDAVVPVLMPESVDGKTGVGEVSDSIGGDAVNGGLV